MPSDIQWQNFNGGRVYDAPGVTVIVFDLATQRRNPITQVVEPMPVTGPKQVHLIRIANGSTVTGFKYTITGDSQLELGFIEPAMWNAIKVALDRPPTNL